MTAGVTMATSAPEVPVRIWSRNAPAEPKVKVIVRPFRVAKSGTTAITDQSGTSRRDNFPNSGGEVGPGITGPLLGKVSCVDQAVPSAGLPLPLR